MNPGYLYLMNAYLNSYLRSWMPRIWVILFVLIFALLRWLFGLALPGAALEFSLGATTIMVGGMISGWYGSRAWFRNQRPSNSVFAGLSGFILAGVILIAFLMNRMVGETQLFDFATTLLLIFLLHAAVGAVLSLFRLRTKQNLEAAHAATAQTQSELQLLQSQLSPHFLFNTLNNIYGLSMSDHQRVPPLLLKLSELLRYSVYDAKEVYVPVKDEIAYLLNYVEFERIRLGDKYEVRVDVNDVLALTEKIAPMLFIVFVENAFKHASNEIGKTVYIFVVAKRSGSMIILTVKNSKSLEPRPSFSKRYAGLGLDNVKKRLSLLYPRKYVLTMDDSSSEFSVELKIELRA